MIDAFKVFDKDGNGLITAESLFNVLNSVGETVTEEEVRELIVTVDSDKDGKINYK